MDAYKIDMEKEHHIWCNFYMRPRKDCRMCSGPKGLWAQYPYGDVKEEAGLMTKHFPDNVEIK